MSTIDEAFGKIKTSVAKEFKVKENPDINGQAVADVLASRTKFSWKGLVWLSQNIVIQKKEQVTPQDLITLFNQGFEVAKKNNRVPLFRGLQFGYIIIPTIVTTNVSQELVSFCETQRPKRFALFDFPVVVDAATGNVSYFRSTPIWGAFFYSNMRNIVTRSIESALKPTGS